MAQMRVFIVDVTGTKKTVVELPDDVEMARLIPALITKMGLPLVQGGSTKIEYVLDHKGSGRRLEQNETMAGAGVEPDDVLRLVQKIAPGGHVTSTDIDPKPSPGTVGTSINIRQRRLQADYDRLRTLVSNSQFIRIDSVEGTPPEKYVISFSCRGVLGVDDRDQPIISEHHQIGVYLHYTYPKDSPAVKWLTPIFHPQITKEGAVDIGVWYASKSLDDVISYFAELIQYKTYDPQNVLNRKAGDWAANHRDLFPIDLRPLQSLADKSFLTGVHPYELSLQYTTAKVVLLGDSGVGKSGLALVLANLPYHPTESTHGRQVYRIGFQEIQLDSNRKEIRETFLWDLAGQPGYRLVHQLHLSQVDVALVVFDARSEVDPFGGVTYWERALRHAQQVRVNPAFSPKKYLVAARADRGGIGVSKARIQELLVNLGFEGMFETSAKTGWDVDKLKLAIENAIEWDKLPKVSADERLRQITDFLIQEKEAGRILSVREDLFRSFVKAHNLPWNVDLKNVFEESIWQLEQQDLVKQLSFGNLVLLQPELLDSYASAMIIAARDEPDGLGSIREDDARSGNFRMTEDERINNQDQEKLLLLATVEDLLSHEIALRESANEGSYLIFPSQLTRENPDLPDPAGKSIVFGFEGPVFNVYATLAVRLSHSGLFRKREMWKNAASYDTTMGGTYGLFLRETAEGKGELSLFFDGPTSQEMRYQFEEFVHTHLLRRVLPNSILRHRIFACEDCRTPVTDMQAIRRRERGFDWIACNVCGTRVSLLDREELPRITQASIVPDLELAADVHRERDVASYRLRGKLATRDYDVFLCHNSQEKRIVKEIAQTLKENGILPWLDEWELRPGLPWQRALEKQITHIKAAAVFVGQKGVGPWQDMELDAFLRQFVKRSCPVIPVILPKCKKPPKLPPFLQGMTWVDFRRKEPDPIEQLIWGITGDRGEDSQLGSTSSNTSSTKS